MGVVFKNSSTFLRGIVSLFLCVSIVFTPTYSTFAYTGELEFRENLQPKIDFWKLVFTKYGKEYVLFHHRDYPGIIYSVLDFSELHRTLGATRKLEQRLKAERAKEERRIRQALTNLSRSGKPSNDFERKIVEMFRGIPGGASKYREAAQDKQIRSQTGIKERFEQGVIRSGRYLYAIEKIFQDAGLPPEISRLPLIESSFDYSAYSSVGAAGIWQFMRATGKQYMRINDWVDERRDPIIASRAATKYLGHAYKVLGEWPLAITSYNHGINGVLRGAKQSGTKDLSVIIRRYKGKSFGFASKNFYVEFLAAVEIEKNKEKFFPGIQVEEPWYFDEVVLDQNTPFNSLVRGSGMNVERFKDYNPSFLKPVTSGRVRAPRGSIVRVSKGQGRKLIASLGHGSIYTYTPKASADSSPARAVAPIQIPKNGRTYIVRKGDTLSQIARKHSVSLADLMQANNLDNASRVRIGNRLIIPSADDQSVPVSVETIAPKIPSQLQEGTSLYEVKPGDTLGGIAASNGISIPELQRLNPGLATAIRPGQKIILKGIRVYRVKPGDTIHQIAASFGVSAQALMDENGITDPTKVKTGHVLSIPKIVGSESQSRVSAPQARQMYTVRPGDSLTTIAKRHGLSLSALRDLNPQIGNAIRPKQKIRVR